MKVNEIMTKNVELIPKGKSISEAARLMRDCKVGAIPISHEDKLIGMITDRDITINVVAEGKNLEETSVEDCMSGSVKYCFEDEELQDVASQMQKLGVRRLPVMNRDKRLVGIVSLEDVASSQVAEFSATRRKSSTSQGFTQPDGQAHRQANPPSENEYVAGQASASEQGYNTGAHVPGRSNSFEKGDVSRQ